MIRCDRLVLTPFISTYNWRSIIKNSSVGDSDNYGSTNRRLRFSEFSFQEIHWIFFSYRSNTVKADLTESMNVYTWLFQEVRVFRHLSFFFFFFVLFFLQITSNLDFTQIFFSRLKRTLAVHSRISCCGGKAHMPQTNNRAVVFRN